MEGFALFQPNQLREFIRAGFDGGGHTQAEARTLPDGQPPDERLGGYCGSDRTARIFPRGKRHRADHGAGGGAHDLQDAAGAALIPYGADAHPADREVAGTL